MTKMWSDDDDDGNVYYGLRNEFWELSVEFWRF